MGRYEAVSYRDNREKLLRHLERYDSELTKEWRLPFSKRVGRLEGLLEQERSPLVDSLFDQIQKGCPEMHRGKKILQIGCGAGGITVGLALHGQDIFGIDLSEEGIRAAYARAEQYSGLGVRFAVADAASLPFPDESFDLVISFQVLEHVQDLDGVLREGYRVLKEGGIFYSNVPNNLWPWEGHYKIFWPPLLPKGLAKGYVWFWRRDPRHLDHIHYLTPHRLRKQLARHGFVKIQDQFVSVIREKWESGNIRTPWIRKFHRGLRVLGLNNCFLWLIARLGIYPDSLMVAEKVRKVMKIGFVSEYFPPFCVGGAELSAFQLAKALVQKGHFVSVLTPHYGEIPEEIKEGIRICRFWFPQRLEPGELAKSRYLENPFYPLYLAVKVILWAKRFGLEFLHAQNTHALVGTFLAARLLKKRVIVSVRDFAISDPPPIPEDIHRSRVPFRRLFMKWIRGLNDRWRRMALSHADQVIFVSHFLRTHYLERGFQSRGRFHVIYNIPPESDPSWVAAEKRRLNWGLPRDAKIVLFGGRRSPGKGMQLLLETIPKVLHRYPRAHFVLVGREVDNGFSKAFSQLKGVTLLGHLPNQDFLDLMRGSDLVISPSIWKEPLSRLLLEAMSLSKPIVATNVGGNPEMILEGENGFLVPSGDVDTFSEKVSKLLEDEFLSRQMGRRGRAILQERFSAERLVSGWESIYTSSKVNQ